MNGNHFEVKSVEDMRNVLARSYGTTVLRFYRPGCPACVAAMPHWQKFVNDTSHAGMSFASANTSNVPELAAAFSVTAVPTFLVFHRGRRAERVVGANMHELERFATR